MYNDERHGLEGKTEREEDNQPVFGGRMSTEGNNIQALIFLPLLPSLIFSFS